MTTQHTAAPAEAQPVARPVARPMVARDEARLRAIAADGARELGPSAPAADVVAWAGEAFDTRAVAVASSMAQAVLPHLVSTRLPGVDVLFLDTGYHFAETLATRDEVAARLDVRVVAVRPERGVAEQDARHGRDLFATDPGLCCRMRKVEPLRRALGGYEAWFTGVRRDETAARSTVPLVGWDAANGVVKINPLATWSFDDVATYAAQYDVPVNPLLAAGYPSIGCSPCTRPVADGEDPRAGRWAGFAKTECGIHP